MYACLDVGVHVCSSVYMPVIIGKRAVVMCIVCIIQPDFDWLYFKVVRPGNAIHSGRSFVAH